MLLIIYIYIYIYMLEYIMTLQEKSNLSTEKIRR